jgi:uncharacterized protein (TIGR02271 family)
LYKKEELPIESEDSETVVPLIEERLEPKKREVTEDATIIKEPSRETQQKEIELTHEELVLERKPVLEPTPTDESPVESRTEIKIPLKREEVGTAKQSYVKEEVVITKKPVTETRTITEDLSSEEIVE